jgi:hypothetical protein
MSRTRELDGIERVVAQCTRMKGFKGFLQRNNLLKKIKQYDGELSNVLQAFQVGPSFSFVFLICVTILLVG